MRRGPLVVLMLLTVAFARAAAAEPGAPQTRPGLSLGMGVSYISARDLVDLVNATSGSAERQGEFASVVEFFGAGTVPLPAPWAIKLDYGYLMGSYTVQSLLGQTEYAYAAHMPTLLLQYVFAEEGVYNIRAGIGPGYYMGVLTVQLGSTRYTGSGPGLLLDAEANTALGDDLFAYLGATVRWSGIGSLTTENGSGPQFAPETTLSFFGLGVRLGLSYYL